MPTLLSDRTSFCCAKNVILHHLVQLSGRI
nr:MAG TPA: hypothetical protein [Caudoviricetes sp.]